MRRSTGVSRSFSVLSAGFAASAILTTILSCSDSTAPAPKSGLDPNSAIVVIVPDSVKLAGLAQRALENSPNISVAGNIMVAPATGLPAFAAGPGYTLTEIPFAPEPTPGIVLPKLADDGLFPNVSIGFDFTFYGTSYSTLNLYYNGFVSFGPGVVGGFFVGDRIPDPANPNNIIALAWNDWQPQKVPGSITYETRGTAPNRRFLIQFTDVPEFGGSGRMTAQLVLSEGSNDITINTTSMNVTNSGSRVTQGIENADGTLALFDSVQNVVTQTWAPRVRNFFKLSNDAIRFSVVRPNQPPVITAPPNMSVLTTPPSIAGDTRIALALNLGVGTCAAIVNPGAASATDDADGVTITGARDDGVPLDAAYPKGVTTITWTATDAGGLTATSTQTITVSDKENPSVKPAANISARTDHGASTATVIVVEAVAVDNCPNVTVSGARSDNLPLLTGYPIGVTTITWTATDASGNTGSAAQTVTVVGNAAPVITAPASLSLKTDPGVCYAVVNPGTATATDDAEGTTVSGVRNDGGALNGAYPKGVTTIMWTATDAEGLGASAAQTVTVADKQKPSVTPPSSISVGNSHGLATASVSVGSATAEDNCHEVSVSGARSDGAALGALYPVGVTTITWTATDASRNYASATQTITVSDQEAPTIIVPADIAVNATSSSGAVVTFAVNAADNVGVTSVSCDHNSGSVFPIGYTSIICVASDAAGNRTSATFGVDVMGAAEQLADLVKDVLSFGLMNGATNPLINQLRSVSGTDPQSCKKMNDFISMVTKKARDMSPEDSTYLITEATRIENVMGCSL
jgi:HYR domain